MSCVRVRRGDRVSVQATEAYRAAGENAAAKASSVTTGAQDTAPTLHVFTIAGGDRGGAAAAAGGGAAARGAAAGALPLWFRRLGGRGARSLVSAAECEAIEHTLFGGVGCGPSDEVLRTDALLGALLRGSAGGGLPQSLMLARGAEALARCAAEREGEDDGGSGGDGGGDDDLSGAAAAAVAEPVRWRPLLADLCNALECLGASRPFLDMFEHASVPIARRDVGTSDDVDSERTGVSVRASWLSAARPRSSWRCLFACGVVDAGDGGITMLRVCVCVCACEQLLLLMCDDYALAGRRYICYLVSAACAVPGGLPREAGRADRLLWREIQHSATPAPQSREALRYFCCRMW